ncbi:lysis protein [Escherichia coli]|nr:lysis protein [Escherichia coli]EHW5633485.1 lysis protein [Escherichia coli]EJY9768573.1 lysis protein [Escherichia coli]
MAHDTKLHNSDDSAVFASRHGRRSRTFKSDWFQHPPCTEEQAEWLIQCYRRHGYEIKKALSLDYTKELADANATIESLRADVSAGRKRLQVAATCAKSTTGASGMGNGESPRLTADAELNYYRLRSGIDKITAQVNYLQEYIRTQCLK